VEENPEVDDCGLEANPEEVEDWEKNDEVPEEAPEAPEAPEALILTKFS